MGWDGEDFLPFEFGIQISNLETYDPGFLDIF